MVDDINKLVNNADFTECIEDAAPHRVKIIKEIVPEMKRVQEDFVNLMAEADWNNGKNTKADYLSNKKDKDLKDIYRRWRIDVMVIFRDILKVIHPNDDKMPSIGMLYKCGSFLIYIGKENLILENDYYNPKCPIIFKKIEDINKNFNNENIRLEMIRIFTEADYIKGEMCKNADMIKKHYYNELPEDIKYDGEKNRKGIKPNHFSKLVRHEAFKTIKSAEKFKNYIIKRIDDADDLVYRETLVKQKTEKF